MNVGSLFSGDGLLDFGLTLAGFDHAWFCESEADRRDILRLRWPGVPVFEDVRELGAANARRVDVLAGGFPCKGASTAGRREGFGHPETVLWREMRRIVGELRPRYVLVENVANILGIHRGGVWGEVLGDLDTLGYVGRWDCIPAAAVGAPHLRDRVFAVATNSMQPGLEGTGIREPASDRVGAVADSDQSRADAHAPAGRSWPPTGERDGPTPDASDLRSERAGGAWSGRVGLTDRSPASADPEGGSGQGARPGWEGLGRTASDGGPPAPDPERILHRRARRADVPSEARAREGEAPQWQRIRAHTSDVDWGDYEPAIRRWERVHGPAPQPLIRGMDDRRSSRVVRSRLSALGDGVQVQVAEIAGRYILDLERERVAA